MVSDETVSDPYAGHSNRAPSEAPRTALIVLLDADDLASPPSFHALDGIEVVEFRRGERSAVRDRDRLVLTVPDPVMSKQHGQLVRRRDGWLLDDPTSKNGAVIAGVASRSGAIEPGTIFELGRTLFALSEAKPPYDDEPDTVLEQDPLASLHRELIAVHEALPLVARSDIPIVLIGKTGTGKEVYARAVHVASERPGPFVAVNCGALSPSLLEAELFGHRKGAFSGATADRPGFVRSADRGTLFLDEINELPPSAQVALLRVLQESEVTPVGDSQPVRVDVRVCVAAQQSLEDEVDAGRFRSDLYARLLGYELHLPELRDRLFDLGGLIGRLCARLAPDQQVRLTPAAARALVSYEWPLNIRELERGLATSLVLAKGEPIELEHLPEAIRRGKVGHLPVRGTRPTTDRPGPATAFDPNAALREQLATMLAQHRGNVTAVARELGKHREQIHRWMRRFGFSPEAFRK